MTRATKSAAKQWLDENRQAIVIEIKQARGSTPRDAETRMLVSPQKTLGTIGGGHLELKANDRARQMLDAKDLAPQEEHFALGPALGQCCGGAVTLGYEVLDAAAVEKWPTETPLFHLQLYGAGHVGRAIATLLATLDARVDWIDEREQEFPALTTLGSPWPEHIRRVCVDAVEAEVRIAPPGAFYLVLTHDHDLDLRITEAVLRRADFAYLGVIGSKTKRERFVKRFEQRGIDAVAIARMVCPIGAPGVAGKAPEVVALATVAQLLGVARTS
jgi:xanthine dehydrogenase accessory factor